MSGDGIRTCCGCGAKFQTNVVVRGLCPACAEEAEPVNGLIPHHLWEAVEAYGFDAARAWVEDVRPNRRFL